MDEINDLLNDIDKLKSEKTRDDEAQRKQQAELLEERKEFLAAKVTPQIEVWVARLKERDHHAKVEAIRPTEQAVVDFSFLPDVPAGLMRHKEWPRLSFRYHRKDELIVWTYPLDNEGVTSSHGQSESFDPSNIETDSICRKFIANTLRTAISLIV